MLKNPSIKLLFLCSPNNPTGTAKTLKEIKIPKSAKALTKIYPSLNSVSLVDYKVRIIDSGSGTEATTRVLIECEDENNERWRSVGLSTNIIDASVMALYDSLTWRLLSLGVKPVLQHINC